MNLYQRLQKTASNLLNRYGTSVALEKQQSAILDPVQGTVNATSLNTDVTLVFTSINTQLREQLPELKSGDRVALLDTSTIPVTGDVIIHRGDRWKVVKVIDVEPADTALLYKVLLRR